MQLFISGQRNHLVTVAQDASVATIRDVVARKEGIAAADQYLTVEGRVLGDGLLADQGVEALATVSVGVRLLGGKVHGSLARAGKVKGQTPKVEKDGDKKKKKTGRAKRRIQYNKRFVNVVVGPGKKRGPNSNSE